MAYGSASGYTKDSAILGNPLLVVQGALSLASQASKIESSIVNIFDPGKARDQQRQARAKFFGDSGAIGSVTAAQYVIGGMQNTSGNEIPYWQAARDQIIAARPDVWQEATTAGARWAAGIPDPGGTQSMVNAVQADLKALQSAIGAPSNVPTLATGATGSSSSSSALTFPGGSSTPGTTLPVVRTTAPYNYTPWLIGGGVVVAALALGKRKR